MQSSKAPRPEFNDVSYRATAKFLQDVLKTGKMGRGPAECPVSHKSSFQAILLTIPWALLLIQLCWSSLILGIAYKVAKDSPLSEVAEETNTMTTNFWNSRLGVSPSVPFAVGWALFVLLALYIREASHRYREGQTSFQRCGNMLRSTLRTIRQSYPLGTWHPGDMDRIVAHMIAYPIALKMTLRGDRTPEQLSEILHPYDVSDVIASDVMHHHCLRVVRAYISVAEDDSREFNLSATAATPAGAAMRRSLTKMVDDIEATANGVVRISEFRPAAAYINHLRIFFYIWIMFLPLALVEFTGW